MISGKIIFIKDKQAFTKEKGVLRLIGNPITTTKRLKEQGITLLHIIDIDAQKGLKTHFDIYDKLTYLINIEVDEIKNVEFIEKLLEINARVVLRLPTKLDLKKWKDKIGFLVAKLKDIKDIKGIGAVRDVILENPNELLVAELKKLKKRIIIYKKDYEKIKNKRAIFLVLED